MSDIFALDVSMGHSYCVWYRGKQCLKEFSLPHNKAGFKQLLKLIHVAQTPSIYFEATSVYSRVVERFCELHRLKFYCLNPYELHLKSQSLRQLKTDQVDAHHMALVVEENHFRPTTPWRPVYLKLHELNRFYEQIDSDWRHQINHLHTALEQTFPELKQLFANRTSELALNVVKLFPHPDLVKPLSRVKLKNKLMQSTDKRMSKAKGYRYADQLLKLAAESYPAVTSESVQVAEVRYYAQQLINLIQQKATLIKQMESIAQSLPEYQLYCSFPGIGKQTAAQLMGELGDIRRFDNANQLNAYVGIDIRRYQSGTYQAQEHINKHGDAIARKLLFYTIGNMLRRQHDQPNHIVDYYYRLKEKQPYPKRNKVAKVACMNKTLKCLLSMVKHHTKYQYRYTDSKSL